MIVLHEMVRNHLASGYFDEVELMRTATEMVDALAPVVLFLPHELTPAEQQFVSAVAAVTSVTAIVGLTGSSADDRVVRSVVGALAEHAESAPVASHVVGTRVICTTDADDEVRAVLGAVADQLRAGVPGHRIGIVYPTANPYARLLHEHLAAAGIECYGRGVKPDAEMVYGRAVRGLLALPDRDFRRAEVMSSAGRRPPGGIDAQRADRISRRAGIVSGADWDLRLTDFARDRRLRADNEEDEATRSGAGSRPTSPRRFATSCGNCGWASTVSTRRPPGRNWPTGSMRSGPGCSRNRPRIRSRRGSTTASTGSSEACRDSMRSPTGQP
ncbi:MAG: hypothetical protein IPG68_06685 [Micrococcales bacterium]|nr:hypothetical protein [Micrococcales bacterium]